MGIRKLGNQLIRELVEVVYSEKCAKSEKGYSA